MSTGDIRERAEATHSVPCMLPHWSLPWGGAAMLEHPAPEQHALQCSFHDSSTLGFWASFQYREKPQQGPPIGLSLCNIVHSCLNTLAWKAPKWRSMYDITWLQRPEARHRVKPWWQGDAPNKYHEGGAARPARYKADCISSHSVPALHPGQKLQGLIPHVFPEPVLFMHSNPGLCSFLAEKFQSCWPPCRKKTSCGLQKSL